MVKSIGTSSSCTMCLRVFDHSENIVSHLYSLSVFKVYSLSVFYEVLLSALKMGKESK